MLLASLISYIDRNTLAILAPTIRADTGILETEYGWVITAFSVAYMIGNPIWGWLLDRFGLRVGMTVAVTFWTIASASHAFVQTFWGFALARAALGFGEGATFPGGLRAVTQSLPVNQQARGVAIAYSGGSLGAIVAPLIVTPILLRFGWRAPFIFTGFIGIAWVLLWQWVASRRDLFAVKTESHTRHSGESLSPDPVSLRPGFGDPRVWAFMFAYAFGAAPLGFILYFSASYLKQTFAMSNEGLGAVLWIAPLGWEVGYFFWGWMSDRLHRTGKSPFAVERRLMVMLAVLSIPLASIPYCRSLAGVVGIQFFAMVVASGFIIVSISFATHIYSRASSGLIAGLGAGMWSAAMAVASPIYGRLFDKQQFTLAFLMASILPFIGVILWLFLAGSFHSSLRRKVVGGDTV